MARAPATYHANVGRARNWSALRDTDATRPIKRIGASGGPKYSACSDMSPGRAAYYERLRVESEQLAEVRAACRAETKELSRLERRERRQLAKLRDTQARVRETMARRDAAREVVRAELARIRGKS